MEIDGPLAMTVILLKSLPGPRWINTHASPHTHTHNVHHVHTHTYIHIEYGKTRVDGGAISPKAGYGTAIKLCNAMTRLLVDSP